MTENEPRQTLTFYLSKDVVRRVTLHPLGIKEISAETFVETLFPEFQNLVNRVRIAHVMQEGGESSTLGISLADEKTIYKIGRNDLEIILTWCIRIDVREFGGSGVTARALQRRVIATDIFNSASDTFDAFCYRLLRDSDSRLVDQNSDPFTLESLLSVLPKSEKANIFFVPLHDSYSNLTLMQLMEYVEIDNVTASQLKKRSIHGGEIPVIERMKGTDGKLLEARRKKFVESLSNKTAWDAMVDATHLQLTWLNEAYEPTNDLNEAGRRLIINAVIIPICAFLCLRFNVEKAVCTLAKKGKIGWGPLDYRFVESHVVTKAAVETLEEVNIQMAERRQHSEAMDIEQLREKGVEEEEEEDEGEELEVPATGGLTHLKPKPIAAKEIYEDNNIAQLGAQLFDLWSVSSNKTVPVRGLLCTGTHWWYFVLTPPETEGGKPTLAYEGELHINVIRDPIETAPARRPSASPDSTVSKDELKAVMEAFAATLSLHNGK